MTRENRAEAGRRLIKGDVISAILFSRRSCKDRFTNVGTTEYRSRFFATQTESNCDPHCCTFDCYRRCSRARSFGYSRTLPPCSLGGLPLNDKAVVYNHSAGAGYWFHARALCTQCGGNRFRAIFRYMSARNVRRVWSAHSSPARFDDVSGETCRQILQISRAHGITWMPNWSRELPCFCVFFAPKCRREQD